MKKANKIKKADKTQTSPSERDSILSFPCEFPIKIMGKADLDFQALVLGIVRKHYPQLGEAAVVPNYSKHNKYISLTVTIQASSQAQLDAIYLELNAQASVIMVL